MASITSTGLGSGMDINGLVTKLTEAERTPVATRLDKEEAKIQARISAYGTFKSALSSVRDSLSGLGKLQTFQKINTTSSDASILTATANANADLGQYRVEVRQLAQHHALSSKAYDTASAVVGTGTLTIKFGTSAGASFTQNPDKGTLTLNIDASNNTLTGVRDAINKAAAGVSAAIIYNGSGYQLVLNSTDSGAKNSMQITVADSGDSNHTDNLGLSALAFNQTTRRLSENQSAQDAQLLINGLSVNSSTNNVQEALKGVTLNLQQAQVGKTVTLGVTQSDTEVSAALTSFVGKFNELVKTVNSTATYDPQTRTGGVLLGESAVLSSMSRLRAELARSVTGLTGSVRNLADIGITTQKDGTLNFDAGKLSKAYTADRNAVAALFAVAGRPSDSSAVYISSSTETVAGQYAVNITRAATQAVLTGVARTGPFTVDAGNDTFKIKVNGVQSGEINLTQGKDATGAELAAELQARINGDNGLKSGGAGVKVSYINNQFQIQSNLYGSDSGVELTEPDAGFFDSFGLTVGAGTTGHDVIGSIASVATRQSRLTGSVVNSLTVDGNNNTLQVNIDGAQSNTINLTQKTYASGTELAAELQTLINNDTALKAANASVSVQYVDNRLQIQSNRQGTASLVEVTQVATNTTATLGLAPGQGVATIEDATRGSLTGIDLPVAPVTVNADNDTFSLKVNGIQSGTISLTPQAYNSHADLATELQTRINADATLKAAGAQVQISVVNNRLQIQSTRYGTDSQVEITGVDTLTTTTLGLAVASGVAGKGIQGQGQLLTAASGDAKGLSMLIEGTQTGSRGTVDFARGLIEVLNKTLASSLDTQGTVSARTKGLNTSIEIITRQRADLNKRMEGYQRQLYIRFNAMDSILGKLQSTSTFLTQQINALNAANKQN